MVLAQGDYLKVSSVDLENHLRYGPLWLLKCTAFSNKIKTQRPSRFIKSYSSPCCTRQALLLLPRDTVKRFVNLSSFQHSQQQGQQKHLAMLPPSLLAQPAVECSSCLKRTSWSQLKSFFLVLTVKDKQDSLACMVTAAFTPSSDSDGL